MGTSRYGGFEADRCKGHLCSTSSQSFGEKTSTTPEIRQMEGCIVERSVCSRSGVIEGWSGMGDVHPFCRNQVRNPTDTDADADAEIKVNTDADAEAGTGAGTETSNQGLMHI